MPNRPDVQDWFRRRTWHQRDFDRDTVLHQLRSNSTAVVIPALDEEETVGEIVGAIRRDLVEVGAVDELVVVDGGSVDATAQVASEAGAEVVHQADAIPGADPLRGKGDSMWKGVGSTNSDLVVFLDADLRSFEPDWVLALVQPMLADEEIVFVKAFYDRPFDPDGESDGRTPEEDDPAGGGRVTELLARPLLNAWWPELSGVVQPLAGEYAGRRDVLETVPFVAGYGVEVGLLVDIAGRRGVDAIAQVDVGLRLHEHQDLAALGRMSAEILRTVAQRAGWGRPDLAPVLVQPGRDDRGELVLEGHDVPYVERPPLIAWPVAQTR